jgi:hypothetical protein
VHPDQLGTGVITEKVEGMKGELNFALCHNLKEGLVGAFHSLPVCNEHAYCVKMIGERLMVVAGPNGV